MIPCSLLVGLALLLSGATGEGDGPSAARRMPAVEPGVIDLLLECASATYEDLDPRGDLVYVNVATQQLVHVRDRRIKATYPVSTARRGLGMTNGSGRTPIGYHRIAAKFGWEVPAGGVLVERRWTGRVADPANAADREAITSRILWLAGQEEGLNRGGDVDSEDRFIYIHGTPDEAGIGRPVSHGCVRMLDNDVIALFDALSVGTPVLILP